MKSLSRMASASSSSGQSTIALQSVDDHARFLLHTLWDVQTDLERIRESGIELSDILEGSFKQVFQHDTWTCPASIQHTLVELARVYQLWFCGLERPLEAIRLMLFSYAITENPRKRQPPVLLAEEACKALRKPAFPLWSEVEPLVAEVLQYLSSDPGSAYKRCLRRRHTTRTGRISFGNRYFNSNRLIEGPVDEGNLECLQGTHQAIWKRLLRLSQDISLLGSLLQFPVPKASSPTSSASYDYSLALDIKDEASTLHDQLKQFGPIVRMSHIQEHTGWPCDSTSVRLPWWLPTPALTSIQSLRVPDQLVHGWTVEDAFGPFEKWAF